MKKPIENNFHEKRKLFTVAAFSENEGARKQRLHLLALSLLTAFATNPFASFAQEADKLYPSTGVAVTGKIVEMTRNGVVMEVRGAKNNYEANIIQRIVYEGEPPALTRAKEAVANEQWDEALESLKKVDFKSIVRKRSRRTSRFTSVISNPNWR